MILKSAFEDSLAQLEFTGDPDGRVGACLIVISIEEDNYASCALSRDSARQLAEALLEFANTESD